MNNDLSNIIAESYSSCVLEGLYWSFGCDHTNYKQFSQGDEFPPCQTCKKPVDWIFQQPKPDRGQVAKHNKLKP